MEQPNYYAVIPANVRYSDISPNAKLLYGELTALSSKEGYCWASNDYFAKLYGVQLTTVSEWVRILSEKKFIKCVFIGRNLRHIYLADSGKAESLIREKPKADSGKAEHSITSNRTRNTSVAIAPLVVASFEGEDTETRAAKPPKYPNAKTVFSWFPSPEKSWLIDTTQLKHAELLFERGEEAVRAALTYALERQDQEYFYKITKPSDLERKWVDLVNHHD